MRTKGQALIEFCFGATVFMLLVAGMVQVVRWTMMNLVDGRVRHERGLTVAGDAGQQLGGVEQRMLPLDPVMDSK